MAPRTCQDPFMGIIDPKSRVRGIFRWLRMKMGLPLGYW